VRGTPPIEIFLDIDPKSRDLLSAVKRYEQVQAKAKNAFVKDFREKLQENHRQLMDDMKIQDEEE